MIWQNTPYTLPLIGASIASIILGFHIWYSYKGLMNKIGSMTILANTIWILGYAMELASTTPSAMIFWDQVQFISIIILPTLWFLYSIYYTCHENWITRRVKILLLIMPVVTFFLTLTNDSHNLIWMNYSLVQGNYLSMKETYGLWFWFYVAYISALVLSGALLFFQMILTSPKPYKIQGGALLAALLFPIGAGILVLSGLNPIPSLNLIPVSLVFSNAIVALDIIYYWLGDILPLARETVIENMLDSVLVLDRKNRVVDLNPAARALLHDTGSTLIGKPIDDVFPTVSTFIPHIPTFLKNSSILQYEGKIFEIYSTPLTDWQGYHKGTLVVLRDITEQTQSKELKKALREKEILFKEVHHRVRNNMQIISSLLNLQSRQIKEEKYAGLFKESQGRIRAMLLVHEYLYQSKDLSHIDLNEYVSMLLTSLFQSFGAQKGILNSKIDVSSLVLSINTAIPCGLIINELISNSLLHAFPDGRKGEVVIRAYPVGNEIELVVSDNGIGLPEDIDINSTGSVGLRLISNLVKTQLKGTITIERNRGTTFRIRFREESS
ncbi:MAG: PAS domain-containing protein [Theionarchaea archaeon]|nr:PAS domain-containing protein [Theionarchaea archaeon]